MERGNRIHFQLSLDCALTDPLAQRIIEALIGNNTNSQQQEIDNLVKKLDKSNTDLEGAVAGMEK